MAMSEKLKNQRKWRRKWVKALRSGKYKKQRNGYLKTNGKFCCLGVLCDIVDSSKWREADYCGNEIFDESFFRPSQEILDIVGLSTEYGKYIDRQGKERHLASDNDCRNFSFKKIADIIESEPEGLFSGD